MHRRSKVQAIRLSLINPGAVKQLWKLSLIHISLQERLQKSGTEEDTIVLRLIVELESRKEQRSG